MATVAQTVALQSRPDLHPMLTRAKPLGEPLWEGNGRPGTLIVDRDS
jgi:hypothetical protein